MWWRRGVSAVILFAALWVVAGDQFHRSVRNPRGWRTRSWKETVGVAAAIVAVSVILIPNPLSIERAVGRPIVDRAALVQNKIIAVSPLLMPGTAVGLAFSKLLRNFSGLR